MTARPPREHGQAIVELLAAGGVLVALFTGLVLIGRLQDLQWTVVQSSRYAAFEAARRATAGDALQNAARARFFAAPGATPTALDRAPARGQRLDANPHWIDHSRHGNPLVARPDDVRVQVSNGVPAGPAGRALTSLASAFDQAAAVAGGRFDVERRGLREAVVQVRMAPLMAAAPFDRLDLQLAERGVVFGGDWGAAGPAQVASRTSALVPTARLATVRPVVHGLRGVLAILEPSIRDLCLGRVDPEVVPADRLSFSAEGPRGGWVAPC